MTKSQGIQGEQANMSKSYRIREEETEALKNKRIAMIVSSKADIRESDLLHALIWKYLPELTEKDVLKYREAILGKDD